MSLRPRGEEWADEKSPADTGSTPPKPRPANPFASKHIKPENAKRPQDERVPGVGNVDEVVEIIKRAAIIVDELARLHKAANVSPESDPDFTQKALAYADYLQSVVTREPGKVLALIISAGIAGLEEINEQKGNN